MAHTPEAHGRRLGGAVINAEKTHCKHGHEFTAETTYVHDGQRKCRPCRTAAVRKFRARRKVAA